tara:strand:+ start:12809 stop:12991 length:183 start_codon:yes stop_codon:yes gene_type:complete
MIEINFQTIKYVKMNFYFFEQIPKLAPEKYWAAGWIHTGTHGCHSDGRQLGLIRDARKTS